MAKKNVICKIVTHGIYTKFNPKSDDLPEIKEFTTKIPAILGIEFGYIVEIKQARGEKFKFRIDHPPFKNLQGDIAPPFEDEFYVNSPRYEFFLGDTIWEPIENKTGDWRLRIFHEGKAIADKTFQIYLPD